MAQEIGFACFISLIGEGNLITFKVIVDRQGHTIAILLGVFLCVCGFFFFSFLLYNWRIFVVVYLFPFPFFV